ncbi:MAG: carboxypeptidase regulatory-like domain-containing protein, partial [Verrucomicrobiae bacterium]|nr:carboxypeptidase regulatory-like domain-containing protein [Verrucomicrobiae bacterium]
MDLVEGLGRLSLQAGVLAVIVGIAQWVFRRHLPPRWRCGLWLLVAARLLLPVSWKSDASLGHWLPDANGVAAQRPAVPAVMSNPRVAPKAAVPPPEGVPIASVPAAVPPLPIRASGPSLQSAASGAAPVDSSSMTGPSLEISWRLGLTGLWALGVFVLLGHVVHSSVRFRRQLARARSVADPAVSELLRACASRLGVRRNVTLQETPMVQGPALCGWRKPRLLLPPGLAARLTPEELRFVFLHELAHVKRRDIPLNWLLTALQILHWFNPLIWLAFHRLRVDRELACDALVLEHTGAGARENYGATILRLLAGFQRGTHAPGLVGILENRRQLRQRIALIAGFTPGRRRPWVALALAGALGWIGLTDPPAGALAQKTVVVLGGRVIGPEGQPVSGATVQVRRFHQGDDANGPLAFDILSTQTTDADGRWQSRDVSEEFLKSTGLRLAHPGFLSQAFIPASESNEDPQALAQLRAGTHVWTLLRGLEIHGKVTDAQNQPLAQARVTVRRARLPNVWETETGPDGRFRVRNLEAGNQVVSVQARGFKATALITEVSAAHAAEIHFVLQPGPPLRGRVVDPNGVPIPGVKVAHEAGPIGTRNQEIEWSAVTDAEGRFEWDSAPGETLEFDFSAAGWAQRRRMKLAPQAEEQVITLKPPRRIVGRVVDAQEGRPIPKFEIIPAHGDAERFYSVWFADQKSFRDPDGRFELTLIDLEHNVMRVHAEDYEPRMVVIPEEGQVEMTIELKPDPGLTGMVVTPKGEPVANAEVALCEDEGNTPVFLDRNGIAKDLSELGSPLVTTGTDGRFKLRSLPKANRVLAVNADGYAEVSPAALRATGTMVLQPWGRIEGVAWSEGRPAAGVELLLTSSGSPRLSFQSYQVVTDTEGRFVWDHVPPGRRTIVWLVKNGSRSWSHSHGKEVEVPPGKTAVVELGRTGTTLTGRVRWNLPDKVSDQVFISGVLRTPLPAPPSGFTSIAAATAWANSPEVRGR